MRSVMLTALAATLALATIATAVPALTLPSLIPRQSSPQLCGPDTLGIISPGPNSTVCLYNETEGTGTSFVIFYCSSAHDNASSVDLTIGLSQAKNDDAGSTGQILAFRRQPTPGVAEEGYYGYKFDVTVYPRNGIYVQGEAMLAFDEVATGYFNSYEWKDSFIDIDFYVERDTDS